MNKAYLTHIFCRKPVRAILHLETVGSSFSLCLGLRLNIESQQRAQNAKNVTPNTPQKRHLFIVWELIGEGRAILCSASAGDMLFWGNSNLLLLCIGPWMTTKHLSIDFWGYKYILVSRRIHKHRICQPWESTINANKEHKTSFNPVARFIPIRIENSMDLIFTLATLVTSVNEPGFSLYHFKFDDVFSTQVPGIKQLKHSVF